MLNWILSSFIYMLIAIALVFVLIGIPLLVLLGVLDVIFIVIGAIKANEGTVWRYPLSIPFFK